MTLVSNFLQIFACKLSSLGPGAELLPQATEIDARKKVGSRTAPVRKDRTFGGTFLSKRSPRGSILEVFLEPFSIKNVIKNQSRNRYRKNMKNINIRCRNYVNNHGQIYEFATLELLVDYVESSVLRR